MSNSKTCDISGLYGVSLPDSHKDPLEKGHLRAAEGRAFAAEALKNHTEKSEEPENITMQFNVSARLPLFEHSEGNPNRFDAFDAADQL